jgi:hypothetical protein
VRPASVLVAFLCLAPVCPGTSLMPVMSAHKQADGLLLHLNPGVLKLQVCADKIVRAGSIVPLGPVMQFATEKPADPIELRVYRGADGTFTLYEDEGDNYNYERGICAIIPISWNEKSGTLTFGKRKGSFPGMLKARTFRVVWVKPGHGVGGDPAQAATEVHYTSKALPIEAPAKETGEKVSFPPAPL